MRRLFQSIALAGLFAVGVLTSLAGGTMPALADYHVQGQTLCTVAQIKVMNNYKQCEGAQYICDNTGHKYCCSTANHGCVGVGNNTAGAQISQPGNLSIGRPGKPIGPRGTGQSTVGGTESGGGDDYTIRTKPPTAPQPSTAKAGSSQTGGGGGIVLR